MDDILYLEIDEEIPSVIEKLKKQPTDDVVLVVPTGAALMTSVVNVKLLKRAADKAKKRIAVVTTDPVGRHIATQVGVPVYVSVKDRRTLEPPRPNKTSVEAEELDLREQPNEADNAGVPVHYYAEPASELKKSGQPQPAKALGFAAHSVQSEPEPTPEPKKAERATEAPVFRSAPLPVIVPEVQAKEPVKEASKELPKDLPKQLKPNMPKKKRPWLIISPVASFVVLVAAAIGLWYYYPKVTVDLNVATEPYEAKLSLIADSSKQFVNDSTGKTLAAEHLQGTADSTQSTPATGSKDVGTAASGTVVLQNRLGQAVKISNGTTLVSSSISFTTTAEVTIPAATATVDAGGNVTVILGQITVATNAVQPGEAGNIAKGAAFTVQGLGSTVQDKVAATAQAAFAGGTSKVVNVVTQTDLDKAKQLATDDATSSAKGKVSGSLAGQLLLDNASRATVAAETPSAKVGDQADSVSDKVTVNYEALVYDPAAFRTAVKAQINASIPSGKMVVMNDSDQIATTVNASDWSAGTLTLQSDIKTQLSPQIDPATILPLIKGKKLAAAQAALANLSTIDHATFTLRPGWLFWLPTRAQAYNIRFVQSDSSVTTK